MSKLTCDTPSTYDMASPGRLRSALLGGLHGAVLEIGPGDGVNLPYYASDVRWIGIEPNTRNRELLRR